MNASRRSSCRSSRSASPVPGQGGIRRLARPSDRVSCASIRSPCVSAPVGARRRPARTACNSASPSGATTDDNRSVICSRGTLRSNPNASTRRLIKGRLRFHTSCDNGAGAPCASRNTDSPRRNRNWLAASIYGSSSTSTVPRQLMGSMQRPSSDTPSSTSTLLTRWSSPSCGASRELSMRSRRQGPSSNSTGRPSPSFGCQVRSPSSA